MRMMLVPLDKGRPIPLEKAVVLFGRSADCDVILANSKKVSRKHCCVAQIDDYYLIRDLGSMNGIRVNQQPVKSESRIKSGDEIWMGDVGFYFVPYDAAAMTVPRGKPAAKHASEDNTVGAVKKQKRRKPLPKVDPKLLSQDFPVAIPEEANEFMVEESLPVRVPRGRIPDAEIAEVEDLDIVSDSSDLMEINEDDIVD